MPVAMRCITKLPDEFDKSVYDRIVSEMNENPNTAAKWIDKFIQDGSKSPCSSSRATPTKW